MRKRHTVASLSLSLSLLAAERGIAQSSDAAPTTEAPATEALGTEAPPAGAFTEEVRVTLIQVEVRVEKDREFVSGLGADDFVVHEDGEVRPIRFVEEIDLVEEAKNTVEAPAIAGRGVFEGRPDSSFRRTGKGASVVVVVDQASSGPAAIARQRDYLRRFYKNLQGTRALVGVFAVKQDGGYKMVSDFSRILSDAVQATARLDMGGSGLEDRRSKLTEMEQLVDERVNRCSGREGGTQICLDAAFDGLTRMARSFAGEEAMRARTVIKSLRTILNFSDHLPGRRSVVLVSEGVDPGGQTYFNTAAQLVDYYTQNSGVTNATRYIAPIQREAAMFLGEAPQFGELSKEAVASGLTLNWINPAHSGTLEVFSPESQLGNYSAGGRDWVSVADRINMMRDLADETGGLALIRAAGVDAYYRRVADDVRRYYVVSFIPSRSYHDGQVHDVKVEVKGKGLKARARRSYRDLEPAARRARALASALDFPDVFRDLPLAARAAYLANADGGYDVAVRLAVPYSQIFPRLREGKVETALELGFVVRNEDGDPQQTTQPILAINQSFEKFTELAEGGAHVDYRQTFQIPPGRYMITGATIDTGSDRIGTRQFMLDLPARGAPCLKATPLMLARSSTKLAEPAPTVEFDEHGDLVYGDRKLTFATVLGFPPNGRLSGLYQLLNPSPSPDGGIAVDVFFRLLREDQPFNQTTPTRIANTIDPNNGSVTNYFEVPYSGLSAGNYRLEVVANDTRSGCIVSSGADFRIVADGAAGKIRAAAAPASGSPGRN